MTNLILRTVKLIATKSILPFEAADESTENPSPDPRQVAHPLPVLSEGGKYLLLDGTRELKYLQSHKVPYVPVQVFQRDSVRVSVDKLALFDSSWDQVHRFSRRRPGLVKLTDFAAAEMPGWYRVKVAFADRRRNSLQFRRREQGGCPEGLLRLLSELSWACSSSAMPSGEHTPATPFRVPVPSGSLLLPPISITDLWVAAASGHCYPGGLVEAHLSGRVLHIDFPLSVLESALPFEEKEAFLRDLILYRRQSSRMAVYDRPVYLLNR